MHISSKVLLLHCIVLMCFCGVLGARQKKIKKHHERLNLLPKWPECGGSVSDRIIDGSMTRIHEFPWIVLVESTGNDVLCGGSLINNRYVLTAAHCVHSTLLDTIIVRLGDWDILNSGEDVEDIDIRGEEYNNRAPKPEYIRIERYKIHEGYKNGSHLNDIALLRLAKPVNYTQFIQPICLPSDISFVNKTFFGYTMEVAGWGKYVNDNSSFGSQFKLKTTVRVTKCDKYDDYFEMCAVGGNGSDICAGDSGGPLMAQVTVKRNPMYIVAGVISYGPIVCAQENRQSIYTKTDAYIDWILNNIRP